MDIGPGDWVECVAVMKHRQPTGFRLGALYLVDEVGLQGQWPYLNFAGMKRPRDVGLTSLGWSPDSFRPVYRPKASVIQSLLQPAPAEKIDA